MKQYTQSSAQITPPDPITKNLAAKQERIAILENRVHTLHNTLELHSRQIRRLESALQLLESQQNRSGH